MTNNRSSLQGVGKMEGNKQASKQARKTQPASRHATNGQVRPNEHVIRRPKQHKSDENSQGKKKIQKTRRTSHAPPLTPAGGWTGGRQPHHTPHHIRRCTAQHETAFRQQQPRIDTSLTLGGGGKQEGQHTQKKHEWWSNAYTQRREMST